MLRRRIVRHTLTYAFWASSLKANTSKTHHYWNWMALKSLQLSFQKICFEFSWFAVSSDLAYIHYSADCLHLVFVYIQLFVYILSICLHISYLLTFYLFVYILSICLHSSDLFTFYPFVYILFICLHFS